MKKEDKRRLIEELEGRRESDISEINRLELLLVELKDDLKEVLDLLSKNNEERKENEKGRYS